MAVEDPGSNSARGINFYGQIYMVAIAPAIYLTREQISWSISTVAHLCSAHSQKEECGSALTTPSLCDVMIQSEQPTSLFVLSNKLTLSVIM